MTTALMLLLVSVAVEAIVEILTSSELTDPFRERFKRYIYQADCPPNNTYSHKFNVWLDKLISCGYCTSVWVAGFFGIWVPKFDFGNQIINWLVVTFVLHRFATAFHVIYELIKKGRVRTYDLEVLVKLRDEQSVDATTDN